MKQIFIDPTSKNCMFSSLEPQGSFLFHRFGKRNIPEEHIDISKLTSYLDLFCPNQIVLESVFGDPLEYKYLQKLCNYCDTNKIEIICITNGFSKNFNKIKFKNIYFIFKIYAFTDTCKYFYPEIDFDLLLKNLKYCNKIQFNVFRENLKDVKNVLQNDKNIEVEFIPGPLEHLNMNHIMTESGKWLHDVYGLYDFNIKSFTYNNLSKLPTEFVPQQTMEGYHLLKNYVKPPVGESILNTDMFKVDFDNKFKKQTSISFKGHIFDSVEDRNIITNTYIPDWTLNSFKSEDQYQKSILGILSKFSNSSKELI